MIGFWSDMFFLFYLFYSLGALFVIYTEGGQVLNNNKTLCEWFVAFYPLVYFLYLLDLYQDVYVGLDNIEGILLVKLFCYFLFSCIFLFLVILRELFYKNICRNVTLKHDIWLLLVLSINLQGAIFLFWFSKEATIAAELEGAYKYSIIIMFAAVSLTAPASLWLLNILKVNKEMRERHKS